MNGGFRQVRHISPIFLNLYTDEIIKKWQEITDNFTVSRMKFNCLLFPDDQVSIDRSDNTLKDK
jgi:hypothetical protein